MAGATLRSLEFILRATGNLFCVCVGGMEEGGQGAGEGGEAGK